ncbi:hypothetical protein BGW39_009776 [Mortierella sp. 14UC]|nr:hypothetical protein BGW39_009776 [Mortierella sp. 14UC]
MGRVQVHCFASTPDTSTIYGLSVGFSSDGAKWQNLRDVIYLINSQQYPQNTSDIRWAAVSQYTPSIRLNDMVSVKDPNLACAVNSAGVFTMLFYTHVTGSLEGDTMLQGIRYIPAKAGAGGQWTTIDVDPNYKRITTTPFNEGHKLFYVQQGDQETLHHAISDTERAVHIGIMKEGGSRPLLQPLISYKNDILKVDNMVTSLAYGNGNLFAYAQGTTPNLLAISLVSPTAYPTANPTIKRFDASSSIDCVNSSLVSGAWRDMYYLLCVRKEGDWVQDQNSRLEYVYSASTSNKMATMATYGFKISTNTFLPIGNTDLSFAPFALMTTGWDVQSITLLQLKHGEYMGGTVGTGFGVWVHDVYGEGPDSDSTSNNRVELSTAELLGIVIGTVVVIATAVFFVWRRLRQHLQEKDTAADAEPDESHKTELNQDAAIEIGIVTKPMASVIMPKVAPASISSLDMVENAGPPPYSGFSVHPRPTIVTSLSDY